MQIGWNKYVLRRFLNAVIVTQLQMSIGREFHSLGSHELNALSPYEDNVLGIESKSLSDDLRVLKAHITGKKLAYKMVQVR